MHRRIKLYCLSFILVCFLASCQRNKPVASTSASPLIPITPTTPPEPSPVALDLLALTPYTHASGVFSLVYPNNWQLFEQPNGVIILEPQSKTAYTVIYDDVGETYSQQERRRYLFNFISKNFADESSNFEAISQETAADGALEVQFATVDPELGPTISQVKILQEGPVIFLVMISTSQHQWQTVEAQLQQLVARFTIEDISTVVSQATPTPPVWTLVGPDSKNFAFLYASNWLILEQTENGLTVSSPEQDFLFMANSFPLAPSGNQSSFQLAEQAALAYVGMLADEYDQLEHLPPAQFPLDTATGATIDFLYTTDNEVVIAGSVITGVANGRLHRLVFTAPAEQYELALEWFNPMYKSFKFLSPENGLPSAEE